MQTHWYTDLTFWMYAVAAAPYIAFVFLYALRTPSWRNHSVGRGLMIQAVSMAAVLTYVCVVLAVDLPEDLKDVMRALLIGGITIAGSLMLRNLIVEQDKARR